MLPLILEELQWSLRHCEHFVLVGVVYLQLKSSLNYIFI